MSPTSVSAFLDALRQFHLLDAAQLDELARSAASDEPRTLAGELIRRGWLSPYQANRLLQGRAADLLLGSYVLLERLGEGGMGQVFKARNWKLGQVVALKLMRPDRLADAEARRRFHQEIRAAAQLNHPHIVHALDADEVNGTHFLVMEYVEGTDLGKLVKTAGPLPVERACDYVRQTALGLQHAHERGLVHRDIKPSNLLLTRTAGDGEVVKILDMGLARLTQVLDETASSSAMTLEGAIMGTPDFISPEQAQESHTVDIRADLYSLGCTFYFLLTGSVPFPGGSILQKLTKQQSAEPKAVEQRRPEVPVSVAAVVRKLMAKEPRLRYQTPAELAAVLASGSPVAHDDSRTLPDSEALGSAAGPFAETALTGREREITPLVTRRLPPPPPRRTWLWLSLLAGGLLMLVVLGMAGLLYAFLGRGPQTNEEPPSDKEPAVQTTGKPTERDDRTVLKGHKRAVLAVVFLPNGLLASASQDKTIKIWDTSNGNCLKTLDGHKAAVRVLTLSPDGKMLISAGSEPALHVWNAATFKEQQSLVTKHPTTVRGVAFLLPSSDDLFTVGDDDTLQWWSIADHTQVGGRFLSAEGWSLAGLAEKERFAIGFVDGRVRLCNHAVKNEREWRGHQGRVKALAYSPNGKLLASGGEDGVVKLWDATTGKSQATLEGHKKEINAVVFSSDGGTLASASADGTVRLWDVATGKEKAVFRGAGGSVGAVAFSADGKTLASGESDGTVRLWDARLDDGAD